MISSMAQALVGSFMPKTFLMPISRPYQLRKIIMFSTNKRPPIKPGHRDPPGQTNNVPTPKDGKIMENRVGLESTREDNKRIKGDDGSVVRIEAMDH
ncbi:hypothetical protein F0562_015786 [Nyssa sinensis]|uniref:Uncharacterized protein n=1 Tax=Nyssa sinensis TaxID=561372 RepID=A0A5J4ZMM7_9ASTE|nr:hypothetical protein F0562_015786 [Nyssa sinensis]